MSAFQTVLKKAKINKKAFLNVVFLWRGLFRIKKNVPQSIDFTGMLSRYAGVLVVLHQVHLKHDKFPVQFQN